MLTERQMSEKKLARLDACITHLDGAVWSTAYAGITCVLSDSPELKELTDRLAAIRDDYKARRDALAEALS
jgi:hypothetical protein